MEPYRFSTSRLPMVRFVGEIWPFFTFSLNWLFIGTCSTSYTTTTALKAYIAHLLAKRIREFREGLDRLPLCPSLLNLPRILRVSLETKSLQKTLKNPNHLEEKMNKPKRNHKKQRT